MFLQAQPPRLPTQPIDGFSVEMPSFGGGYIVRIIMGGRIETVVFTDHNALTGYLAFMLSGAALALGVSDAAGAPKPDDAGKIEPAPIAASTKRKGRPPLSEAEKAANRARRAAMKANGADHAASQTAESVTA